MMLRTAITKKKEGEKKSVAFKETEQYGGRWNFHLEVNTEVGLAKVKVSST
jgi:hypothetical protein